MLAGPSGFHFDTLYVTKSVFPQEGNGLVLGVISWFILASTIDWLRPVIKLHYFATMALYRRNVIPTTSLDWLCD
jgi:hypothetical protein